ncbi:MAG: hypothetical protein Q4F31_09405 [Eubacteriales bacterium]|nr:hypothetical protein [Eubacteriales bacterium]
MNDRAFAYFAQLFRYDELIRDNNDLLLTLKEKALKTTSSLSRASVQNSGSHRQMADTVDAYADLEQDILSDTAAFYRLIREMRDVIAKIPDPELRIVLERRFLLGLTVPEIASGLGFSATKVRRLLNAALDAAEIPEDFACSGSDAFSL